MNLLKIIQILRKLMHIFNYILFLIKIFHFHQGIIILNLLYNTIILNIILLYLLDYLKLKISFILYLLWSVYNKNFYCIFFR